MPSESKYHQQPVHHNSVTFPVSTSLEDLRLRMNIISHLTIFIFLLYTIEIMFHIQPTIEYAIAIPLAVISTLIAALVLWLLLFTPMSSADAWGTLTFTNGRRDQIDESAEPSEIEPLLRTSTESQLNEPDSSDISHPPPVVDLPERPSRTSQDNIVSLVPGSSYFSSDSEIESLDSAQEAALLSVPGLPDLQSSEPFSAGVGSPGEELYPVPDELSSDWQPAITGDLIATAESTSIEESDGVKSSVSSWGIQWEEACIIDTIITWEDAEDDDDLLDFLEERTYRERKNKVEKLAGEHA